MAVHCVRRASRGCVDEVDVDTWGSGVREERRVSWRPGAEGAPRESSEVDEDFVEVLVVDVGWEAEGTMRRDWRRVS